MFFSLIILTGVISCLHFNCAAPNVAGSSTETGNVEAIAVTATILDSNGAPAVNAAVLIREKIFTKDIIDFEVVPKPDAVVDSNGVFIIDSLDTGEYYIEVNSNNTEAILLECIIQEGDTLIELATDTLQPTATITGTVSHTLPGHENLFVQVYGLDRLVKIDTTTMQYTIPNMPEGDFAITIVASNKIYQPTSVENISATAGSITVIDTTPVLKMTDEYYVYWQFRKSCVINTTPSGADMSSDVYNFPLLIRLDATSFTFSEAQYDGRDIRFTKPDGTPLYYQIEQWDVQNKSAALWVLIDTVYGADNTQSFRMYWGNNQAQSRSNGEMVFNTANYFASTWHLNNSVFDATANNNDGTNYNSVNITGIVGDGRYFDGSDDYISFGNDTSLKNISETISTSCWIKTSLSPDTNVSIIRHDGHYTGLQTSFGSMEAWVVAWTPTISITAFPWDSVFNDNTWHHYVSTYDKDKGVSVFLDGKQIHADSSITGALAIDATEDFFLGGNELGGEFYEGLLDEVRVSSTARSGIWIKLCYENQKTNATMVIFK